MKIEELNQQIVQKQLTVGELMETPEFKKELKEVILHRNNRGPAGEGLRYKRDSIDTLIENNLWNEAGLTGNYFDILSKTSTLSSSCRRAIKAVVEHAMQLSYIKILKNSNDGKETIDNLQ